jgi:hypothetical protein
MRYKTILIDVGYLIIDDVIVRKPFGKSIFPTSYVYDHTNNCYIFLMKHLEIYTMEKANKILHSLLNPSLFCRKHDMSLRNAWRKYWRKGKLPNMMPLLRKIEEMTLSWNRCFKKYAFSSIIKCGF